MMGKNKQGRRRAGILSKTVSCLGLGKATGSAGGSRGFPPAKEGKTRIWGVGVVFVFLVFFSNICYMFFSSHEGHIVGQEHQSLGILKMQTEFCILFQGDNTQWFVNILKDGELLLIIF